MSQVAPPLAAPNSKAPANRAADVSAGSVTGLTKTFISKGNRVNALNDIDLTISQGEYVVILGPSGCGKSTLLRCIAGLETPTEGRITLDGRVAYDAEQGVNEKVYKRNVGMVFQNYALWPHMNIESNVAYPLKRRKVAPAERATRVADVLERLECAALAKRLPSELSGGQQQRIALARALVYEPSLVLLDEPLSALDALLRVSLRTELIRLHRTIGFTALHITHDQEEALEMGDRVVLMRDGRIEQVGTPRDVYARPVSPYAANFLGVRNRVTVRREGARLACDSGVIEGQELAASVAAGEPAILFVRPRDTSVSRFDPSRVVPRDQVAVSGVVTQIVLGDGGREQYLVEVGGNVWYAEHADEPGLAPGDEVQVSVAAKHVLLYQHDDLVNQ